MKIRNIISKATHISIKLKLTIWYTCFISLIILISLLLLIFTSSSMTKSIIERKLIDSVENAKHEINYNGHNLVFLPGIRNIEFDKLLIYDENMSLIYGNAPSDLTDKEIHIGEVQTITIDGIKYYIYDSFMVNKGYPCIYIRGVMSLRSLQITNDANIKLACVIFPALIIISSLGGYLIIKRAFRPINNIIDTVDKISDGEDLTKRIDETVMVANDEVSLLSEKFNKMFDRLQLSFENEKQFTSDASHELRTPMTVIMAQAEYLQSICKNEDEINAVNVIIKQSTKVTKLISELLLLARADSNEQKLNIETINISEIAETVIEELEYMADEKEIKLISRVNKDILMRADQTMIMRMLINLITNAIKYGKKGGKVEVTLYRKENKIIGTVADDGIGISSKDINKIWDRFYQVDQSRSNDLEGSGLGLSMVKCIVSAHDGKIDAKSEPQKGTTFTFVFYDNLKNNGKNKV